MNKCHVTSGTGVTAICGLFFSFWGNFLINEEKGAERWN